MKIFVIIAALLLSACGNTEPLCIPALSSAECAE